MEKFSLQTWSLWGSELSLLLLLWKLVKETGTQIDVSICFTEYSQLSSLAAELWTPCCPLFFNSACMTTWMNIPLGTGFDTHTHTHHCNSYVSSSQNAGPSFWKTNGCLFRPAHPPKTKYSPEQGPSQSRKHMKINFQLHALIKGQGHVQGVSLENKLKLSKTLGQEYIVIVRTCRVFQVTSWESCLDLHPQPNWVKDWFAGYTHQFHPPFPSERFVVTL